MKRRAWVNKKKRVVVRIKKPPKISEIYQIAWDLGITTNEYVQYLASMNSKSTKRRNRSTMYDMGPLPYRKEPDDE